MASLKTCATIPKHFKNLGLFVQLISAWCAGSLDELVMLLHQGCILIDPKGKRHFLSYRLEFECTNNITEYEALVQGLKKSIDLNVKELKVFEDSEIIDRQARNTIHCNYPHLKNYQQEVYRLIENLEAFNITVIPRKKNILADSLATTTSKL